MNINLTLLMQAIAFAPVHLVHGQVGLAAGDASRSRPARSRSPTASPRASGRQNLASAEKRIDRYDRASRAKAQRNRRDAARSPRAETIEQAKMRGRAEGERDRRRREGARSSRRCTCARSSCASRSREARGRRRGRDPEARSRRQGPRDAARDDLKRAVRTHHGRDCRPSPVLTPKRRSSSRGRRHAAAAVVADAALRAPRSRPTQPARGASGQPQARRRPRRNRCSLSSRATGYDAQARNFFRVLIDSRPRRAAAADRRAVRGAQGRGRGDVPRDDRERVPLTDAQLRGAQGGAGEAFRQEDRGRQWAWTPS